MTNQPREEGCGGLRCYQEAVWRRVELRNKSGGSEHSGGRWEVGGTVEARPERWTGGAMLGTWGMMAEHRGSRLGTKVSRWSTQSLNL